MRKVLGIQRNLIAKLSSLFEYGKKLSCEFRKGVKRNLCVETMIKKWKMRQLDGGGTKAECVYCAKLLSVTWREIGKKVFLCAERNPAWHRVSFIGRRWRSQKLLLKLRVRTQTPSQQIWILPRQPPVAHRCLFCFAKIISITKQTP